MPPSTCLATDIGPDTATFLSEAIAFLPIEERYDYHRTLKEGTVHRLRRDATSLPTPDEMSISDDGWRVLIHAEAGTVARFGADDMREFLRTTMQVSVIVESSPSLNDWAEQKQVIVAGTPDQLSGMGTELKGTKDYEIRVTPDQIVICGYDDLGVIQGLFNLEARMSLREGPFLPRNLKTVRHSRFQTRMVISWLGWMQWPDTLLSHLAHDGYDAIYASVYANPNGVAGPPHYDIIRKQNAARLLDQPGWACGSRRRPPPSFPRRRESSRPGRWVDCTPLSGFPRSRE